MTHEIYSARNITERILFFDVGTIIEDSPPETIFTKSSEERTREFL